jgi:hypothetical protein
MSGMLFLDIDGVLNSTSYWHQREQQLPLGKAGALDPESIGRLNRIVTETGCAVVLSSSWRGRGGPPVVQTMLRERGFVGTLIDATPFKLGCPRCAEIDEWLCSRFGLLVPDWLRYVVLDDDSDAFDAEGPFAVAGRFVQTNYLVGLQDNGVDLAIEWLGPPSPRDPYRAFRELERWLGVNDRGEKVGP